MQSIYRFREAEVGLFLRARREGIGAVKLEPLTLAANFRSQAGLVDWFNDAFSKILPAEEDETAGAVPYSPSAASKPALAGEAVQWHCFYDREAESAQVIKILRAAKDKAAILVRNRTHLDDLVPALKEAGIRFRAVEIDRLGEKQVVQDLYALTRALSHPGDRVAWLAVLRAPWCGLALEDLCALAESGRDELIPRLLEKPERLSLEARKRVMRAWQVLGPALAGRVRRGLRDRVEEAWLALGGPACVEDETDLEDAEIFLDELERLERAGEADMEALGERLEALYALPDVNAGPGAVEIMTIHKAKGLEFDTVIVPGLDRLPRAGPRPLFAWKSLPGGKLLLAPINETGEDDEPLYQYIRGLEREAEDIEAGRLFYVAATRAKSRLHLLACAKPAEDGTPREPVKRTLLSKIWGQARSRFGPAPAGAVEEAPRTPLPNVLRRLPADFATPPAPAAVKWSAPPEGREASAIEFSWARETARHIGTVVHRWLQRIAEDELRGWDAARVDSLKIRFTKELERRGVSYVELKESAELVAAALKNSLADERGRWVLGPHAEARSEYRLRVHVEAQTRTFVMDRVFRSEERRVGKECRL